MQKGFIGIIVSFVWQLALYLFIKMRKIVKNKKQIYVKQQNVQAKGFDDGQLIFVNIREVKQEAYKHILLLKILHLAQY